MITKSLLLITIHNSQLRCTHPALSTAWTRAASDTFNVATVG